MASESEDPKLQEPEIENPKPPSPAAFPSLSLNIWPPSQRTRDAVTSRLVDTLSSPSSVLAKRYGVLPAGEAAAASAEIEKEAFAVAEESAGDEAKAESVDGGLEMLEIYSKTISRRMLEVVKARHSGGNAAADATPPSLASLSIEDAESRTGSGESVDTEAPAAA